MPASPAPSLAAVRPLLERARAVVCALPETHIDRLEMMHRVGLAAVEAGEIEWAREGLAAIDSPAHRAHLLAAMARWGDRQGRLDEALARATEAVNALEAEGRWRPVLPDWLGPDSARADLCALRVSLGDHRGAAALAATLGPASMWRVRAVAALSHLLPAADGWETVADALRAVGSPEDRARAALDLLSTHAIRPRLGPDAACALQVIDAVVDGDGGPGPSLAGARVAARLARILLDVPALTAAVDAWARTTELIRSVPGELPAAVSVLCGVTRDQLSRVGPGPAAVTWDGLLERLTDEPLPPDPPQRGPWAEVLALGLHHPSLAPPLARIISRHPAVPSAWAHALGLLHLRAGRPDRALRVAEVLAAAAQQHEEDHESLLMGALLQAQTGDGDGAWDALLEALGPSGGRMVWLSGGDGPQPYERWAVDALLDGGAVELAMLLARLVGAPGLRAQLLASCLERLPAGEGAAALADEIAASISEADALGLPIVLDETTAQLPRAVWDSGDAAGAESLLQMLMDRLNDASVHGFIDGMACLARSVDRLGPAASALAGLLESGWSRRIEAAEPEDAVELLLARVRALCAR